MNHIYDFKHLSYEARAFSKNVFHASSHFMSIVKISSMNVLYVSQNILRLFFIKPVLRRMIKPGVFEEVKNHPPPNPPFVKFF